MSSPRPTTNAPDSPVSSAVSSMRAVGTETCTVQVAFRSLWEVAVMIASPWSTPVTTPSLTVATLSSELVQSKSCGFFSVALAGVPLGRREIVSPANTLAFSGSVKLTTGTITRTSMEPVTPEPSRAMPVRVTLPALLPTMSQVPSQLFLPEMQLLEMRQLKSLL